MSGLKRRQLLAGAATVVAQTACGRPPTADASRRAQDAVAPPQPTAAPPAAGRAADPATDASALTGRVLGFGIASQAIQSRFAQADRSRPSSVVIEVDLGTGFVRHRPLPVTEGHEPVLLAGGELVCVSDGGQAMLFIDPSTHAISKTIRCDPGFEYSGHARVVDDRLVVTVRQRGTGKMRGRLDVFSMETRARTDSVDTGGHVPHEIVVLEDRDEIAISHYGHFGGDHFQREPFFWDIREAAVSFLDRRTLAVKRRFVYERPLALTHMRRASSGKLYVVAAQYVRNNPAGFAAIAADGSGLGPRFVPAGPEKRDQRISMPGPVVVVDPDAGIVEELMPEPQYHRKQQSLAVHAQTGQVFVTFTDSDRVMRIDPGSHAASYIAAADLELSAPCGVVDITGTPYVAVSGRSSDLVIVDAATGVLVRSYPAEMFSNVHLGYATA